MELSPELGGKKRTSWPLKLVGALMLSFLVVKGLGSVSLVSPASTNTPTSTNTPVDQSFNAALKQVQAPTTISAKLPPIYAKNYILLDAQTAEVIVEKNADEPLAIASLTKMTTALTARHLLKEDQVVSVDSQATRINGSKVNLLLGEKITVDNLIKGLLIQSGNDAAWSLAAAYNAEQPEKFVDEMNKFVTDLGLKNTKFGDPAGLDDEVGRSTARDQANIARVLVNDPVLAGIVATAQSSISSVDGQIVHQLKNTDRLIDNTSSYYLPGALGGKTGYTELAGHCLVSSFKVGDRILVGGVFNTVESTPEASAKELRKLFLWAEKNFQNQAST